MSLALFYVIMGRMATGSHNFNIVQGETFTRTITWREPSMDPMDPLAGDPYDITGYEAKFPVAKLNGTEVLELTDTDGLTIGDDAGTIKIVIDSADTDDLTDSKYKYELSVISPDAIKTYLLRGYIVVKRKVDVEP